MSNIFFVGDFVPGLDLDRDALCGEGAGEFVAHDIGLVLVIQQHADAVGALRVVEILGERERDDHQFVVQRLDRRVECLQDLDIERVHLAIDGRRHHHGIGTEIELQFARKAVADADAESLVIAKRLALEKHRTADGAGRLLVDGAALRRHNAGRNRDGGGLSIADHAGDEKLRRDDERARIGLADRLDGGEVAFGEEIVLGIDLALREKTFLEDGEVAVPLRVDERIPEGNEHVLGEAGEYIHRREAE